VGGERTCSGCGNPLAEKEGVEALGIRACATCFIQDAGRFHRTLKPEEIELLKTIGREAAGFMPPELVRIILVGFYQRGTGGQMPPPEELARCIGEIQRLALFATTAKTMNLLKTWQDMFNEFVDSSQVEMRESIKRLTDVDG
jgi:hypothetical protein